MRQQEEAVGFNRTPGIVFVEGRDGRRAAVASTGVEVWEIVAAWREAGESWVALVNAYPELSTLQLRDALNYYALHPQEIDERLAREAAWTPERVAAELPFSAPDQPEREERPWHEKDERRGRTGRLSREERLRGLAEMVEFTERLGLGD